ncbi:SRPBCC domain-containing protein [Bacillus salacetis]|uniref:SRPBCC domain-containing protein n=1 Tax=Bacillus salacetis TaxID=2315464 RepID=A0A3A1QSN2_9BACI|nr:SRPBCC domain-containing protein [Bacillus salacetis]RIW30404.1 SRPBCC domain-containing protein [Bacillus salacetis]
MSKMISKTDGNILILEREFNAPKDLVFNAFSKPEQLTQWWGPSGWVLTSCSLNFTVDGTWYYCTKCTDINQGDFYGIESWGIGVYTEIIEGEKIVYTDYFSNAHGNESDKMPSTKITLTFEEIGGKTKLINRAEYGSAEALKTVLEMGVEQGISETWDRLDNHLDAIRKQ